MDNFRFQVWDAVELRRAHSTTVDGGFVYSKHKGVKFEITDTYPQSNGGVIYFIESEGGNILAWVTQEFLKDSKL